MAKRRKARRPRIKAPTSAYTDDDGNVLRLRDAVSPGTVRKIAEARAAGPATIDDDWRRETEILFERLVVSWQIAGLPLDDQKMLLGRWRMADTATQEWVRSAIARHIAERVPELSD